MKYQLTEEEKGLYAQIAFEQGIEKKSSEIVRQLLKRGFDLEMISAITELSREKIEAIQKEGHTH